MENETKNIKETEGVGKPAFQQPEPAQLNDGDLQNVAGGAICDSDSCGCNDTFPYRR